MHPKSVLPPLQKKKKKSFPYRSTEACLLGHPLLCVCFLTVCSPMEESPVSQEKELMIDELHELPRASGHPAALMMGMFTERCLFLLTASSGTFPSVLHELSLVV